MKNKENSLVWEVLTDDEKSALMLSINFGKSTWQAGEIMNKAHYKYLEIQARANKFFRMFNEYFQKTNNLKIPEGVHLNPYFKEYILKAVFEREKPKDIINSMGLNPFIVPKAKYRIFKETMDYLGNHEDERHHWLYDLIMDFDRWNNFRILTPNIEEPSAFKRRNKTKLIKHLKNLTQLNSFHIERFSSKFSTKSKVPSKYQFITLLSEEFEGGYQVIKIKKDSGINDYISKNLRLYTFDEEVDADEYGFIIIKYLSDDKKTCRTGQKFWPRYRKVIEKSNNYLEVNNILPRRKNLEKAFKEIDYYREKNYERELAKLNDPQKRVDEKLLWNI
jgi:hypothetical protein